MKVKIALASTILLGLAACGNNNPINPAPTQSTSPSVSETTINSDPTTAPPRSQVPEETEKPTNDPEPATSAPTSDPAAPPATQFAQRWGNRYPNVPEFAILKAANGTCRAIAEAGSNWENNQAIIAGISVVISSAGIEGSEALEFAQDADQNYCASVANPT